MLTDPEIIEAVLQGDADRYGELVSRYQLAAWKLAYSFVDDWEEAKDLSQNGFVKAYRHLARFRGESKFSTWLYRIVVNECKDFLRRRGRRPETVPFCGSAEDSEDHRQIDAADPRAGPREEAHQRDLSGKLSRAICMLPMKQRSVFILRHLQGLPLEEVARVMGCRIGTAKTHLFRASESLRLRMEPFLNLEA